MTNSIAQHKALIPLEKMPSVPRATYVLILRDFLGSARLLNSGFLPTPFGVWCNVVKKPHFIKGFYLVVIH